MRYSRYFLLTFSILIFSSADLSAQTLVMRGHTGNGISAIAISSDGKSIASGGLDRTVRIWNADAGKAVRIFAGHKNEVYSVAFSPDGKEIASSDYGGTVMIWNASSGKVRLTLKLDGWSTSLAFSPDGSKLAAANQMPGTVVFDVKTGKELRKIPTRGSTNTTLFSRDGLFLLTASSAPGFWNLDNLKIEKSFRGHNDAVRAMAISSDGKLLASASSDKTARLWDIERGQVLKVFETSTTIQGKGYPEPFKWKLPVTGVAFSPDTKLLAAATGRSIHLWNISTGENSRVLEGHENTVTSVGFMPDGHRIVSASTDNTVRVWKVV